MTACHHCGDPLALTDALPPGLHARCAIRATLKPRPRLTIVRPDGTILDPTKETETMETKIDPQSAMTAEGRLAAPGITGALPSAARTTLAVATELEAATLDLAAAETKAVTSRAEVKRLTAELQGLLGRRTRTPKATP